MGKTIVGEPMVIPHQNDPEQPNYHVVGTGVPRVDDLAKVTGKKVFGFDEWRTDMLHAKVFRSTHPHARIVSIDTSRAKSLPGVAAVLTGADVSYTHGLSVKDEPFLARDRVRYVGEPVVAVAAESLEIAEEAISLITVEYEPLPAVFDPDEAMRADAPLLHEDLGSLESDPKYTVIPDSNVCNHYKLRRGDVDSGFASADYVFEDTFMTQMQAHCCIEPHMAIAQVDPTGKLTLWTNSQAPYRYRKQLARALGVSQQKIRIVICGVGGGFGGKLWPRIAPIAFALAMHLGNRPVRLALSREEEFANTVVRHPAILKYKTGVTKEGLLVARQVTAIYNTGAYADCGPLVARNAGMTAAGPYRIPNVTIDSYCVYTNNPISGAFRGYGVPQVAWAYESQLDIIAAQLDIDPLELRLKNGFEAGDLSATGETLQSVGLKKTLHKAAEAIQWGERTQSAAGRRLGKGLACMHKLTNTPTASLATVMLNEDGDVQLLISTIELGTGIYTALSQMVAEELGVSPEKVHIATPDTDYTPYETCTSGSRSVFHVGNAILDAIRDAKGQLLPKAVEIMQADISDLEWRQGKVYFKGESERGLPFNEIIKQHYGSAGADVVGRGFFAPQGADPVDKATGQSTKPSAFWMYATQAAEVEVDVDTGQVTVLRIVAAHDVGRAINPVGVKQQVEGGVIQGVGAALFEEMLVDQGKVLNADFERYRIPTALDVPPVTALIIEEPHPEGPYGAKGVGEPVLAPTGAAIANAIYDAVGVRIRSQPITAEKVLQALKEKEEMVEA